MEKIKLTQEQATAIERYAKGMFESLEAQLKNENYLNEWAKCLAKLEVEEVVSAIRQGYKIEPQFKVGDWVHYQNGEFLKECKTRKIRKIEGSVLHFTQGHSMFNKYVRHATPEEIAEEKQRRWWAKYGREVKKLYKGDVIKNKESGNVFILKDDYEPVSWSVDRYEVVCFSEDRKDIKESGEE